MSKKYIFLLTNIPVWSIFLLFIYSISFYRYYNPQIGYNPDSFLLTIYYAFNLGLWLFGSFYLSFGYIVPKYLVKGKRNKFWLYSFVLSFTVIPIIIIVLEDIRSCFREDYTFLYTFKYLTSEVYILIPSLLMLGFFTLMSIGLGVLSRMAFDSFSNLEKKKDSENKQLLSELNLLKSKLNPHLLFNSLNNIDTLIQTNSNQASASLTKLSDILRYVVYESDKEKVSLKKEIEIIESFIELEKLRLTQNASVVFNSNLKEDVEIPPMLFFPFIENAFKHSNLNNPEHRLVIDFLMSEKTILFKCNNTINVKEQTRSGSGKGLELAKKRLYLLLSDTHKLTIESVNNEYQVTLEINL
ncbi:MAG: histidine kinase [Bacteroidales bacterium]|nr:histidine kinase [Bacteroidales bacterium]